MAVFPNRVRQPSLEQLSSHRRSSTANAIRKKHIKISDPLLIENQGPSPVSHASPKTFSEFKERAKYPQARSLPSDSLTDLKLFYEDPLITVSPNSVNLRANVVDTEKSRFSSVETPRMTSSTAVMEPYTMGGSREFKVADHSYLRQHVAGSTRRPQESLLAEAFSDSAPQGEHSQRRPNTMGSMHDRSLENPTTRKHRSGSIRKAFGRLFSKRDKEYDSSEKITLSRHAKNASESGAHPRVIGDLDQVFEEDGLDSTKPSPRLQNMEQRRERRSHSPIGLQPKHSLPFPMNINGAQPAPYSSRRMTDDGLKSPQSPDSSHKRRATVPSIVLSPTDADTLSRYWNRAPSVEPEVVRERGRTPTSLIGLAITSNTASKRRSRSADALRELAIQQMAEGRRRSAETQVNPWRLADQRILEVEEADPNTPRSHHASVQEASQLVSPYEPRPSFTTEHIQASDVYETANEDAHTSSSDQRELSASGRRSIGDDQPVSPVDKRLSQLELNMNQLEQSMQALSGQQQAFTLHKAPKARADTSNRQETQGVKRQVPMSLQHPPGRSASVQYQASPKVSHARPSPSLHAFGTHFEDPTDDEQDNQESTAYPYKAAHEQSDSDRIRSSRRNTARPSTPQGQVHNFSIPYTIPKDSPTRNIDQIAPIYAALQYERAVRKQLENTVSQLQHDVLNLTTIVYEMRGLGAYPTPSPDYALGIRRNPKHPDDSPPELAQDSAGIYEQDSEPSHSQTVYGRARDRRRSCDPSSPMPEEQPGLRRNY